MRLETSPVADYFSTQETNMTWMTNGLHILNKDCSFCVISIFFFPLFFFCRPTSASLRNLAPVLDSLVHMLQDEDSVSVQIPLPGL